MGVTPGGPEKVRTRFLSLRHSGIEPGTSPSEMAAGSDANLGGVLTLIPNHLVVTDDQSFQASSSMFVAGPEDFVGLQ